MRILFIHNKYKERGGEDSVFEAETELLRSHGHEVRTLIFDNSGIGSLASVLKLSYKMFYNSDAAKALEAEIAAFRPEVIHVHNFFYVASPAVFFVANKYKIPVLFTVHNFRLICSGALLLRDGKVCEKCVQSILPMHGILHGCHRGSRLQTAQLTFMTSFHKLVGTWRNKVTRYVVLTDFAKQKLLNSSLGLKPEQIVVKPNCVDNKGYTGLDQRQDYFLFIGRLTEEKGIDILLKARDLTNFPLKIIGTGPLAPLVEEYSKKYDNVEYLGFRDSEFIMQMLKGSRALLFPSIWYEGMPRTILEAYSTGTPVIASDIENINEIVEDKYNGLHFRTGTPEALAEVLEQFKPEENVEQAAFYEQARQTFLEKYTYEGNYHQLIGLYSSLANQPEEVVHTL